MAIDRLGIWRRCQALICPLVGKDVKVRMMLDSSSSDSVPHTENPKASRLFLDYLYDFKKVSSFYQYPPFHPGSYRALSKQLDYPDARKKILCNILRKQNQEFSCGESTLSNIDRLAEPGTFAVVTGQQVGLFSGPSFALYKALTTVRLAAYLSEEGIPSVPVFWAATEDHDLDEVSTCNMLDSQYKLITLRASGERPSPKCSVGQVQIPPSIEEILLQVRQLLPDGPSVNRLVNDLEDCYQPGASWGKAFCSLMARLFEPWGVVLVDPSDASIQQLASDVYQKAANQASQILDSLKDRSQALLHAGYHAQVHLQEGSTLLFTNSKGSRVAVRQGGGAFHVDGIPDMSPLDMVNWISRSPHDFSSNVLLRPLVQDHLLPTLAYVAGPSEVAYLGQANALYQKLGRPQPVIFPRAGFTLVDSRTWRWLDKYGLQVEDAWKGIEHLEKCIAAASGISPGWSERFNESRKSVLDALECLRKDVKLLDPTLLEALNHSKEKIAYQLTRLQGKLARSTLQRSEILAKHKKLLLRFLFPQKNLQEREVSGIYFLGHTGYELLSRIYDRIKISSSDHQLIKL